MHVCANHLTKVEEKLADCTNPGNKEHYKCSCGKLYEDATATVEITDHSTVVVPALGHDWAEATCTQPKTCQRCDATEGEALGHDWEEEWNTDETNHWHACTRCDATADLAAHIPDHEGGATMDYPILCTVCGHMMEKQLEPITLQIQLPFQLTVKQTDEMAPGPQTFQFVAEEFGAPVDYVMVNDTVETNGVKTYEGVYSFTITDMDWGNLSEGFRFRQVKGSAEGWTYDETAYYAVPESWGNDVTVSQWTFYPLTAEGYPDYDNPAEEAVFVNSYAAKKPVEPTQPPKPSEAPKPTQTLKPVQPPQTGDHSQLILWATLLVVSGAVGTAMVSQKRRKNVK